MKPEDKGIIVRKTIEDDLPQIFSIGRNIETLADISFGFNAENLADIFASERSICYSAVRKKKVLGFIAGSFTDTESVIRWIMVSRNLHHTGIGKTLLTSYIEESEKSGINNFLIEVSEKNDSAEFFTRFGFNLKDKILKLRL